MCVLRAADEYLTLHKVFSHDSNDTSLICLVFCDSAFLLNNTFVLWICIKILVPWFEIETGYNSKLTYICSKLTEFWVNMSKTTNLPPREEVELYGVAICEE